MKEHFIKEYDRICRKLNKKGLSRDEFNLYTNGISIHGLMIKLEHKNYEALVNSVGRLTSNQVRKKYNIPIVYKPITKERWSSKRIHCKRNDERIFKSECVPKHSECIDCPNKQNNYKGTPDIPDEQIYYRSVGDLTNFSVQG